MLTAHKHKPQTAVVLETTHGHTITGHAVHAEGKRTGVVVPGGNGCIRGGEILIERIRTVGREEPTLAERARDEFILRLLRGELPSLVQSPFVRALWFPEGAVGGRGRGRGRGRGGAGMGREGREGGRGGGGGRGHRATSPWPRPAAVGSAGVPAAAVSGALGAAGARSQVVSNWSVDDDSTARLMALFYARLKTGVPRGAALRNAMLQLQSEPTHSHPFYWAPFFLLGDWR